MKIEIDVTDYSAEHGPTMEWEAEHKIETYVEDGVMRIVANRDGLVSLARLLLTLAQSQVPTGSHWHLDESNSLEDGSVELIIERM
jgi:hypothetical protein